MKKILLLPLLTAIISTATFAKEDFEKYFEFENEFVLDRKILPDIENNIYRSKLTGECINILMSSSRGGFSTVNCEMFNLESPESYLKKIKNK